MLRYCTDMSHSGRGVIHSNKAYYICAGNALTDAGSQAPMARIIILREIASSLSKEVCNWHRGEEWSCEKDSISKFCSPTTIRCWVLSMPLWGYVTHQILIAVGSRTFTSPKHEICSTGSPHRRGQDSGILNPPFLFACIQNLRQGDLEFNCSFAIFGESCD